MAEKIYQCKIRGISPFLMHNGQLADPFNQFSKAKKELTGKRAKTEADMMEIARLDWFGGLYVENKQLIIPQHVLQALMLNAAKKRKLGKSVGAGLQVVGSAILSYPDSGLTFDELYQKDEYRFFRNVRNPGTGSKVMLMRPIIPEWSAVFSIRYYDDLFNANDIQQMLAVASDQIGIGDWRPEKYGSYGRFEVVE